MGTEDEDELPFWIRKALRELATPAIRAAVTAAELDAAWLDLLRELGLDPEGTERAWREFRVRMGLGESH